MTVDGMNADSPAGLTTVLTVVALWSIPANLISYAKRKGLVYRNCDVHFLFPVPVNPKKGEVISSRLQSGVVLFLLISQLLFMHVPQIVYIADCRIPGFHVQ